jgi:hypothetical protein
MCFACSLRLIVTDTACPPGASGGTGFAEVTVTVNMPPRGGTCTVRAAQLNTYQLSCFDWSSPRQPLTYQWVWQAVPTGATLASLSAEADVPLSAPQLASSLQVALPYGTVRVLAYIVDSLGARTVSAPLLVTSSAPATDEVTQLISNWTSSLGTALNSQDRTAAIAAITVLNSLLSTTTPAPPGTTSPTQAARDTLIDALDTYVLHSVVS